MSEPKHPKKLEQFSCGDIIRNKLSGNSYVITSTNNNKVLAMKAIHINHPNEWVIVDSGVVIQL